MAQAKSADQPVKRRAACDECRTKKLRCSGIADERLRCVRCKRENILCVFSPQKQMGRPKKRLRHEEDATQTSTVKRIAVCDSGSAINASSAQTEATDVGIYDNAFTPGGNLQPWLRNDWPAVGFHGQSSHIGHDVEAIPGLTPDSTHSTPVMLETQSSSSSSLGNSHANSSTNDKNDSGNDTSLLLDPTLNGVHSSYMPNCACLSTLYLTLNALQSMNSDNFNFPFSLHPLREAMQTASAVLICSECPKRFISGIHNVQLVGTLLMSIAERFGKVLQYIDSEANRASIAGDTKTFRLTDLNTPTAHLHAGGLGCAAAFSIDLSSAEWRRLCKKVVRAEIHGPEDGNTCCPCFVGICKQMEERQMKWHSNPCPEDFPRDANGLAIGREGNHAGDSEGQGEHLCLKLVGFANRLVADFDWS